MDAISMYDRGRWSSKSETVPGALGFALAVAFGLVPVTLLLWVMI